jgi:phosphate transport system substrate-binding protein
MLKTKFKKVALSALVLSMVVGSTSAFAASLKGKLEIDGSSTLFPLTSAIAEEFQLENKKVKPTVSESGTGTGIDRFCKGEITIADASRQIKPEEVAACTAKKIKFTEFKVALDGITVIVNQDNTWAKQLTTAQLKSLFEANSKITKWSDLNKKWPKKKISFFSPGAASGTFEFFTEHINGTKKVQRTANVTMSEDDNILVTGVAGDKYAIGYLGFGYYNENKKTLNAVAVKGAGNKDYVAPSLKTIKSFDYAISRNLYVYVDSSKLKKGSLENEFMRFYLESAAELAPEVSMVSLKAAQYKTELKKVK